MDTISMNSWNCKTSHPNRLLLDLSDEINLKKNLKVKINMLNLKLKAK